MTEDMAEYMDLCRVLYSDKCSLDIVRILLNYGADVNCPEDEYKDFPLLIALIFKRSDAIIRLLIENGADLKARNGKGMSSVCGALSGQASIDVLELLLMGGCHPDDCGYHGSVLECIPGCWGGGLKDSVLDLLIKFGADVLKFGSQGQSPVCLALRAGFELCDIQRLLKMGASLDACQCHSSLWLCATDYGTEAYERRRYYGKIWGMPMKADVFELLRTARAPADSVNAEGYTSLQLALQWGNYETEAIKMLIDLQGEDFSVKDSQNRNLLHFAVENFHCKESAVKFLIERGVKLAELDLANRAPLFEALSRCDIGVSRLLLEHGSPVNGEDRGSISPLRVAILCRGFDFIQLLLFHGARIEAMSYFGGQSLLEISGEQFLERGCPKKLDDFKLLVKHSFLENSNFEFERLISRCKNTFGGHSCSNCKYSVVEELISFANKCSREVQVMRSKYVCINGKLLDLVQWCLSPGSNPLLCDDEFNRFLSIIAENDFSQYFDILSNKVGESVMKTKLGEVQVYTVKNYSGLNSKNRNIYLNYECLLEIIQFLSAADLLRLILA